jgi:hypothetical protein
MSAAGWMGEIKAQLLSKRHQILVLKRTRALEDGDHLLFGKLTVTHSDPHQVRSDTPSYIRPAFSCHNGSVRVRGSQ